MEGVRDLPGAGPGTYRDGGLLDYHLDLPYEDRGVVLYPHFTDKVIPGWFDKGLPWRRGDAGRLQDVLCWRRRAVPGAPAARQAAGPQGLHPLPRRRRRPRALLAPGDGGKPQARRRIPRTGRRRRLGERLQALDRAATDEKDPASKLAVALIHGIGDQPDSRDERTVCTATPANWWRRCADVSARKPARRPSRACTGPAYWTPASWTTSSASSASRWAGAAAPGGDAIPRRRQRYRRSAPPTTPPTSRSTSTCAADHGPGARKSAADAAGDPRPLPGRGTSCPISSGTSRNSTARRVARSTPSRPGNPGSAWSPSVATSRCSPSPTRGLSDPPPGHCLPPAIRQQARWLNVYAPADPLGYPLRPLQNYAAVVHEDLALPVGPWCWPAHPAEPHRVPERCALHDYLADYLRRLLAAGLEPAGRWPRPPRRRARRSAAC